MVRSLYTIRFRKIGAKRSKITHYYARDIVEAAMLLKDDHGYNVEIVEYVKS